MFAVMKTILAVIGLLVILVLGFYLGKGIFTGSGEELGFFRSRLAGSVAGQLLNDLEGKPEISSLCILIPSGEKHGLFKEFLVGAVEAKGIVVAPEENVKTKLKEMFQDKLPLIETDEQAASLASLVGASATLKGDLKQFSRGKNGLGAAVDFSVRLVDAKKGALTFAKRYKDDIGSRFSLTFIQGSIHESSPWMRIFLWILFVALLPLASLALVKRVLRKQSNVHNGLLLAGYTGVGLFAALALTGFYISGFWVWALLFLALACACLYNFVLLTKVEELSH
jgi:hypothetical protein